MAWTGLADTVVIVTALKVEFDAVQRLLVPRTVLRRAETEFQISTLQGHNGCRIALACSGKGNIAAAMAVERAKTDPPPLAVLFVGIAGALHDDLELGDVVVASKVYPHQSGVEGPDGFSPTPDSQPADRELVHIAHVVSHGRWWHAAGNAGTPPEVRFNPIASGDVVLNSARTQLREQLRQHYNDTAAIDMDSAGAATAAQANRLPFLAIRSISDKADGNKYATDKRGWQKTAADNAAAFALEVAAELHKRRGADEVADIHGAIDVDEVAGLAVAVKAEGVVDGKIRGTARVRRVEENGEIIGVHLGPGY